MLPSEGDGDRRVARILDRSEVRDYLADRLRFDAGASSSAGLSGADRRRAVRRILRRMLLDSAHVAWLVRERSLLPVSVDSAASIRRAITGIEGPIIAAPVRLENVAAGLTVSPERPASANLGSVDRPLVAARVIAQRDSKEVPWRAPACEERPLQVVLRGGTYFIHGRVVVDIGAGRSVGSMCDAVALVHRRSRAPAAAFKAEVRWLPGRRCALEVDQPLPDAGWCAGRLTRMNAVLVLSITP